MKTLKKLVLNLWNARPLILKKSYWIEDFPSNYNDECFMCNNEGSSCTSCEKRTWDVCDFVKK